MVNVKIAVLLIVASVLVVAIAGVTFAQFAGAHANASRGTGAQYPRGGY